MTRGGPLILAVMLLAISCGGSASIAPSAGTGRPTPAPTRNPSKDALPLLANVSLGASPHTFQGGDDHVTLVVDNRGRDIHDLTIEAGPWLAEHTFSMGSSRYCQPDIEAGLISCGPVYAGDSLPVILRTTPAHVGTFHYELRLADRGAAGLLPIDSPEGSPIVLGFDEVVDQVTSQIPGGRFTPSPEASS